MIIGLPPPPPPKFPPPNWALARVAARARSVIQNTSPGSNYQRISRSSIQIPERSKGDSLQSDGQEQRKREEEAAGALQSMDRRTEVRSPVVMGWQGKTGCVGGTLCAHAFVLSTLWECPAGSTTDNDGEDDAVPRCVAACVLNTGLTPNRPQSTV
ncbi:hypothetical protein KC325_g220 [Hortaea werneckii]|nr:hypothetical protein KC325_g220 [Hortaea werneckii]